MSFPLRKKHAKNRYNNVFERILDTRSARFPGWQLFPIAIRP
jgi:hypothetical protein